MRRIAVKIAYLGDGYSGSQVQPGTPTVEAEVLGNLQHVLKRTPEELNLRFSSRTDKGVNSLGNAIVFDTPLEDPDKLLKALNSVSDGIFYRSYCFVDGDFNVRHASRRLYRYTVPSKGMDPERTRECCRLFEGEHDFIRFCRPDGKDTVLTLDSVQCTFADEVIYLDFNGRYYLWNMIRRISAAIISVGRGRLELSDVREALDGADRTFGMARPDALTLMDVQYDWLTFTPADRTRFVSRKEDGQFTHAIRSSFYDSL